MGDEVLPWAKELGPAVLKFSIARRNRRNRQIYIKARFLVAFPDVEDQTGKEGHHDLEGYTVQFRLLQLIGVGWVPRQSIGTPSKHSRKALSAAQNDQISGPKRDGPILPHAQS